MPAMRYSAIIFLLLLAWTQNALGFACNENVVSLGFNKAEVLIKCGKPTWTSNSTQHIIDNAYTPLETRFSTATEQWIYNFGPNRLVRILTFENGRLTHVDASDYGYLEGQSLTESCAPIDFKVGRSLAEIRARCGQPFFTDSRREELLTSISTTAKRVTVNSIEEWTYNFGPNQFLRILTFRNGYLSEIRTGERGL